jgi:putative component of membrane protein insertase Oxa1/YidC/SpoIIIJ protein YidD
MCQHVPVCSQYVFVCSQYVFVFSQYVFVFGCIMLYAVTDMILGSVSGLLS